MSKGEIIDFVVLRITTELDKFERTTTIPHTLLEGAIEIGEIKEVYYEKLSPKYQKIFDKLLKEYHHRIGDNIESLKKEIKNEINIAWAIAESEPKIQSTPEQELADIYAPFNEKIIHPSANKSEKR